MLRWPVGPNGLIWAGREKRLGLKWTNRIEINIFEYLAADLTKFK
jgi:hypothetical protein